jgi:hypothetical protein
MVVVKDHQQWEPSVGDITTIGAGWFSNRRSQIIVSIGLGERDSRW